MGSVIYFLVGLVLMASQAFFYNAIFFTYALVLGKFYGVPSSRVGVYMLAFAGGNFFGPLLLGHFFDSIGRKRMITATYGLAGLLMAVTAILFAQGLLDAAQQTAAYRNPSRDKLARTGHASKSRVAGKAF